MSDVIHKHRGTGKSGWCLEGRHDSCRFKACTCECHREGEGWE